MKNLWIRISFFLLGLVGIVAISSAAERAGASFLTLPGGARAVGLGAAAASMADDADLMNVNPAGLAALATPQGRFGSLALSHQSLFVDSTLTQLGAAMPLGRSSSLGFNIVRLSYADSQGRSADRSNTGSIQANDNSFGMAYAKGFGSFQLGTQLKVIHQELGNQSANGLAADLGFISRTPVSRLSFGGAVRNVGSPMKFDRESYSLPLTFAIGSSYQAASMLGIGVGLQSIPNQHRLEASIGTEIQMAQALTFRTGYIAALRSATSNESTFGQGDGALSGINGLSGGIGLHLNHFKLDYAVQPFGELGTTHTFTLSSRFDTAPRPAATRTEPQAEEQDSPNRLKLDIDPSRSPLVPR